MPFWLSIFFLLLVSIVIEHQVCSPVDLTGNCGDHYSDHPKSTGGANPEWLEIKPIVLKAQPTIFGILGTLGILGISQTRLTA